MINVFPIAMAYAALPFMILFVSFISSALCFLLQTKEPQLFYHPFNSFFLMSRNSQDNCSLALLKLLTALPHAVYLGSSPQNCIYQQKRKYYALETSARKQDFFCSMVLFKNRTALRYQIFS